MLLVKGSYYVNSCLPFQRIVKAEKLRITAEAH